MVWQQILGQLSNRSNRSARKRKQRRLQMERMERRELLASDLGAIAGVAFVDQAGDGFSPTDPAVLVDGSGDLVAPGTPGAQGVTVQLFEDTDGSTDFNAGDQLIGTDITDLDGNYRFDNLVAGRYFLQQQAVPQLNTPNPIGTFNATTIDVTVVDGIQTALIDDYSQTAQSVTADGVTTVNSDSATAPEAIGNERNISVTNANVTGQVTVLVDAGADILSIGSIGLAEGTALIQYDGADGTSTLDPIGLRSTPTGPGISLAGGSPGDTLDPGAGFIVQTRADQAGDTLFITVHTDGSNSSSASVPVPQTATPEEVFVRFATFGVATGTGADFNNVGAIEASINLSADTDVTISIAEARRPEVVPANTANVLPVSLGGRLFSDNADVGQNNGIREGTEPGLVGITVELYELAGANDTVDPTNTALTSTTTSAGGVYSFPGLDPGHYAVVVPASQFAGGGQLFGFANSTGNDPASDPDDNALDDDNGTALASGDVVSGTITLESNSEPTNDDGTGPADANSNNTVDFGFFPQIDLVITKTLNAAASSVVAGGNAVFDIVVTNNGPLEATNVEVQDIFPAGLTFTGIQNTSGSFTQSVSGTTVTVDLGSIASGTNATFQLTSDIAANQTADITNTATVSGDEVETMPADNTSSAVLDLVEADLRIVKTSLSDPVNAGGQLTYQLTVTNDGPDAAAGVVVTDPLPVGVTFVSGNVDGQANLVTFDNPTRTVTANIGALTADTTNNNNVSVVTIIVDVATDAASPLTNSATVASNPNSDPDPTNNDSSVNTVVERAVDVGVTKTVNGTPIAGQTIEYMVSVTNNGPSQARGVIVTDTLESQLSLVAGSFDAGTSGVTLAPNGQALTFDVGLLDANQTVSFTFDVTIDSAASGTIPNVAVVTTTDNDTDNTNDSSTANIAVQQQVDLILQKTVDRTNAVPGQDQLVYTFTISHDTDSSSDATNVVVTDVLPAGLTGAVITDGTPPPDSTDFSNNTVTVGFNSIPVGETRTFTVTVDVDASATGDIVNPASVASDGTDIDPANNTSSATTTMNPDFDIVVNKSVNDSTPGPNGTVIYTVGLNNEGPSDATGIVLTDAFPSGLTFQSGTLNGQNGASNGTTVTFPAIDLASGASTSATLTFTVDATASGTLTNTASVPDLSGAGENDLTNNSDTADITVTPVVDLVLDKTVDQADSQAGGNLVYTIEVTNNGPSEATNVQVADTLPAGVTFTSGTGPNGETLSATNGVVNFNAGALANGASITLTINATINAGASGNQVNSATVTTDTNESNSGNNTDTAETTVDPLTSTIGGSVYIDANDNGVQDAGELGIAGVELVLSGNDSLGNPVNATATTSADGSYLFSNLAAGTYTVTETQPRGFRDGIETVGTGANASAADNVFTQLGLGADTDAISFNFGERNEALSKRRFLASS